MVKRLVRGAKAHCSDAARENTVDVVMSEVFGALLCGVMAGRGSVARPSWRGGAILEHLQPTRPGGGSNNRQHCQERGALFEEHRCARDVFRRKMFTIFLQGGYMFSVSFRLTRCGGFEILVTHPLRRRRKSMDARPPQLRHLHGHLVVADVLTHFVSDVRLM